MRTGEAMLVRILRARMARIGAPGERTELLQGAALGLHAAGWSPASVARVIRAVADHVFGEEVGGTVARAVTSSAAIDIAAGTL